MAECRSNKKDCMSTLQQRFCKLLQTLHQQKSSIGVFVHHAPLTTTLDDEEGKNEEAELPQAHTTVHDNADVQLLHEDMTECGIDRICI